MRIGEDQGEDRWTKGREVVEVLEGASFWDAGVHNSIAETMDLEVLRLTVLLMKRDETN